MALSWLPVDAILVFLFATLYAGFYALLGKRGYRRLLLGWLASLGGSILGYYGGQALNIHVLWVGTFPWPEVTLGAALLLVVASRVRI
jgi:hypothetical protein